MHTVEFTQPTPTTIASAAPSRASSPSQPTAPDSRFRLLPEFNGLNGFIFSVMAEIPSHSSFADLSPADHVKILQWLLRHKLEDVKTLLAQPRPEGCALQTSIMSISRYKKRFLTDYLCERHERDLQAASGQAPHGRPQTAAALKTETLTALRHRLFHATLNPEADPFKLRALACTLEKIARYPTTHPANPATAP